MKSDIWGPHFWFFLHTIAYNYPDTVNQVTKRKYYDFIHNLPLFIPEQNIGNTFSSMLDKYPLSPYLDNRDSFMRWIHFIHNKYNSYLGKEEISLQDSIEQYLEKMRTSPVKLIEKSNIKRHIIYATFFLFLCFIIYVFYK